MSISSTATSRRSLDPITEELVAAWSTCATIPVPFTARDTAFDLDHAYAVESELGHLREANGHKIVGRKVGFANKAMWRVLKLETLVWASMYEDTVHTPDSEVSLAGFISPKIEPEIVFKLRQTQTTGPVTLEAVEWLALGFEIIDCPFPDWQFKPADFVAAYGLHRALIVGEPHYIEAQAIPELFNNLATFKLNLLKNGQLIEEGTGKNSLKSPALCLEELAAAVLRRTGLPLQPGEIISTGTLTAAPPISPGEIWQAEVEGLPLDPLVFHNLVGGSQSPIPGHPDL